MLVPNSVCQLLAQKTFFNADAGTTDFHRMFMLPLGIALGSAIVLALFFHPPKTPAKQTAFDSKAEPAPAH